MKYKTVIWDFNGTLLDDVEISMNAMNVVLNRRNLKKIPSTDAFRDVFSFPVENYYQRLGIDFSKEPFKVSADEWVELYSKEMYSAPIMNGAKEALGLLKNSGIRLLILSASEKQRLSEHLNRLEIDGYFDEVHGANDVYARGKDDIAKILFQRKELFPAVLIGDTDHDFKCAQMIGADCILYSKGFMSKERLKKLSVPVFDDLLEIAENIIKE